MFLLTNDDGIEADGLDTLKKALSSAFPDEEIWVVAPASQQSMVGHRTTTTTPLSVEEVSSNQVAVEGTPADCIRIALFALGLRPRVVFSGVNHGGNMGQDIPISGTVAAVREAAYHGIPGMAFSQYLRSDVELDWGRTEGWIRAVVKGSLEDLICQTTGVEALNINFPALRSSEAEPGILATFPEVAPLPVEFTAMESFEGKSLYQYSGNYSGRASSAGSDVDGTFGGAISISRLQFRPASLEG